MRRLNCFELFACAMLLITVNLAASVMDPEATARGAHTPKQETAKGLLSATATDGVDEEERADLWAPGFKLATNWCEHLILELWSKIEKTHPKISGMDQKLEGPTMAETVTSDEKTTSLKQTNLHDKYKAFYATIQNVIVGRFDVLQPSALFSEDFSGFALECVKGWKDEYKRARERFRLSEDHALFKYFAMLQILLTLMPEERVAILLQNTIENCEGTARKFAKLVQNEQFRDWEANGMKVTDVQKMDPFRTQLSEHERGFKEGEIGPIPEDLIKKLTQAYLGRLRVLRKERLTQAYLGRLRVLRKGNEHELMPELKKYSSSTRKREEPTEHTRSKRKREELKLHTRPTRKQEKPTEHTSFKRKKEDPTEHLGFMPKREEPKLHTGPPRKREEPTEHTIFTRKREESTSPSLSV
uniref:Uncharacterized protein n=1 Tax=Peronospora matthiolae TaxID=2874970 RepID=A0AAV1T1H1_9STRA